MKCLSVVFQKKALGNVGGTPHAYDIGSPDNDISQCMKEIN